MQRLRLAQDGGERAREEGRPTDFAVRVVAATADADMGDGEEVEEV